MPKFTVMLNASVNLTIDVEVGDKDQAYDRAKEAFYDVLNGGNIAADVQGFEMIDCETQEELSDEEEDARETMIEKGWRRATIEELEQGFCTFQHADGVQVSVETWGELMAQDPDTSIVE